MVLAGETCTMDYMKKRFVSLLETAKFSDCCFVVRGERIPAHKVILAASSPVFEAMLYGQLAATDVAIDDMAASDFRQMLTFLYTDAVQLGSVINAWQLIYVAKKYLIDDLLAYCLQYLRQRLEAANLLLNLEFAELFSVECMRGLCMRTVRTFAKVVLHGGYHMKASTLCSLLDEDACNASEQDLVYAAVQWAYAECQHTCRDVTRANVRSVLVGSGVLGRLRFLALPPHQPLDCNELLAEILDDEELLALEALRADGCPENRARVQRLQLCLNGNPRSAVPVPEKLGYRRVLKTGDVYHASGASKLTTRLVASRCVLVNGFLLPTRRAPETSLSSSYIEHLDLTITDVASKKAVRMMAYVQTLTYGTLHTVKIAEPVLFEEGTGYDVDIAWSARYLQWANEYSMHYLSPSVVAKDVQFEFCDPFDCGFIQGVSYCPI